ncbi:MAG: carboxymuconolactone decarboxylase family protein, partial [Pseudomonadota bacterium]
MVTFTKHTIDSAPEEAKENLAYAEKAYGFLPNLYRNMAEAPTLFEGYLKLSEVFGNTSFSETERQIILMTNNRLNGCKYCMAAHTTIAQSHSVPDDVIEALRNNTPISDEKLEHLRQFAAIINETRGNPTEAELKTFLDAGYTKQNVLEILVGT